LNAMFGAKLLICMSVADKAETAFARLAARLARCRNFPSHFAHSRWLCWRRGWAKIIPRL
jgi:hypothetical protein